MTEVKLGALFEAEYAYDRLTGAAVRQDNDSAGLSLHNGGFALGPVLKIDWLDIQATGRYNYAGRQFQFFSEEPIREEEPAAEGLTSLPGGSDVDDTIGDRSNQLRYHRLGAGLTLLSNSDPLTLKIFGQELGVNFGVSGAYFVNGSDAATPAFENVDGDYIPTNYNQPLGPSGSVVGLFDIPMNQGDVSAHLQFFAGVQGGHYPTVENSGYSSFRGGVRLSAKWGGVNLTSNPSMEESRREERDTQDVVSSKALERGVVSSTPQVRREGLEEHVTPAIVEPTTEPVIDEPQPEISSAEQAAEARRQALESLNIPVSPRVSVTPDASVPISRSRAKTLDELPEGVQFDARTGLYSFSSSSLNEPVEFEPVSQEAREYDGPYVYGKLRRQIPTAWNRMRKPYSEEDQYKMQGKIFITFRIPVNGGQVQDLKITTSSRGLAQLLPGFVETVATIDYAPVKVPDNLPAGDNGDIVVDDENPAPFTFRLN